MSYYTDYKRSERTPTTAELIAQSERLARMAAVQAAEEQRVANILSVFKTDADWDVETVLYVIKRFTTNPDKQYHYAALRTSIGWSITGSIGWSITGKGATNVPFCQMLEMFKRDVHSLSVWMATEFEEIACHELG